MPRNSCFITELADLKEADLLFDETRETENNPPISGSTWMKKCSSASTGRAQIFRGQLFRIASVLSRSFGDVPIETR